MSLVQCQTLNTVLENKDAKLFTTKGLTADHFSNYKAEYDFIVNHIKAYNQVPDKTTFLKSFPDFEVIQVNEPIDYLVSELYKEKTENLLAEVFNNVRKSLTSGNVDKATSAALELANKLAESKHLEAVDILSDISRYDEYVDKCNNFKNYYVSTGFKELDGIIGGWDMKNEYATIIARTGMGKTWTLLKSVTASIERGLTVGLYSGEMELNKVSYRIDTLMSHISNTKLVRGNADVSTEYKKYLDNLQKNHRGKLYILTPDMIDGDPTVDSLTGFIDKYNLDILFIDQQTLLIDKHRAKTTFDKAANISKDLKMLQVRKHIPIVTVTQQNRTTVEEGKFATSENIGQSDRIGQDSTTILAVSKKEDVMTIYVVKARDGGTGRCLNYEVNIDKGKFVYIRSDDEEDEPERATFTPSHYDVEEDYGGGIVY